MNVRVLTIALGLIALSAPAMAQGCPRLHHDYERADGPKAWAQGADGGCGYASARDASTLAEARRNAMDSCRQNARGCRITEEER